MYVPTIITHIVDEPLMESVVLGFRELEFYFEGFETVEVYREPNKLVWQFKIDGERQIKTVFGKLGDEVGIEGYTDIHLNSGDVLILNYTLTWSGGGGDEVWLPRPMPGASLCFEVVAA